MLSPRIHCVEKRVEYCVIFVTRVLQHYYEFHFCNMSAVTSWGSWLMQPQTDQPAPWSVNWDALYLTSQYFSSTNTSSGLTVNAQKIHSMCFSARIAWILSMHACLHMYACSYVWVEDLFCVSCHRFAVGRAGPEFSWFRKCWWEQEQRSSSWRGEDKAIHILQTYTDCTMTFLIITYFSCSQTWNLLS